MPITKIILDLPAPTHHDYDKEVLIPLRAAQAKKAKKDEEARLAKIKVDEDNAKAAQAAADALAAQTPVYVPNTRQTVPSVVSSYSPAYGNNYTAGQCTFYVASRVSVPSSMGNATNWESGLLSAGWVYGLHPGSIGVSHLGWAGHVVYVEWVSGGSVGISEMNYAGVGVVSFRTVSPGEFAWLTR